MKISKFKLIWSILFTKGFFSSAIGGLQEVIFYATRHYGEFRGDGASDVAGFIATGKLDKILNKT